MLQDSDKMAGREIILLCYLLQFCKAGGSHAPPDTAFLCSVSSLTGQQTRPPSSLTCASSCCTVKHVSPRRSTVEATQPTSSMLSWKMKLMGRGTPTMISFEHRPSTKCIWWLAETRFLSDGSLQIISSINSAKLIPGLSAVFPNDVSKLYWES